MSTFNASKYQTLMRRMEAVEVKYSMLETPLRIEAEYYWKKHLRLDELLKTKKTELLSKLLEKLSDGTHFTPEYTDDGIPFLSALNVLENRLDMSVGHMFISETEHKFLYRRCDPREGDILLRKVGVGPRYAAVVPTGYPEFSIFVSVALLRPNPAKIKTYYLSAFINSCYGQQQLLRFQKGMSQPDLHLEDIERLTVPMFSWQFQENIEKMVLSANSVYRDSEKTYSQAEQSLLRDLGLGNWQTPDPTGYLRKASETLKAERLDAEYFHPKYDELFSIVKKNAARCRFVHEFRTICQRGEQPQYYEDGTLAVINSRHILEQGLDYDNFERTHARYWDDPNFQGAHIQRNDVLTYMTGANVGRTAIFLGDGKSLASNEVNILRLREEDPVYVAVVMNSMVGRLQTRQTVTGSAQVHLYPSDIESFLIPFISAEKQTRIVTAVQKSHEARKQAKSLLEKAKRAVEIAIEEDESKAMQYLSRSQ